MTLKKILILGGTAEAREIAALLLDAGCDVTTSLAGVTSQPLLPQGKIRSGGFGGVDGLRGYIETQMIDVLIDATHPFAAIMSRNAVQAVQSSDAQLFRFERPAWAAFAGDHWIEVASLEEAAANLPIGTKVFITTGRKELHWFLVRPDIMGTIRTVEPPSETLSTGWQLILDRPPHSFAEELALFQSQGFTHLVTKNAGGESTRAKLDVARHLGLPVIVIQRPAKPDCESFSDIPALIKRLGTSGCSG